MKKILSLLLSLIIISFLPFTTAAQAQPKKEALVEQVKRSIDKGISYLKQEQQANGSWTVNATGIQYNYGGSCLALLALLEAGVPVTDDSIKKGLNYVRGIDLKHTYTVALQTMVLAKAGFPVDREKIKKNVDWLIEARVMSGNKLRGWSYTDKGGQRGDGSNTQFALLGLWAAKEAGIDIPEDVWKSVQDHYIQERVESRTVRNEPVTHWEYVRGSATHADTHMTMTTAGICGLLIAGMEMKQGREVLQKNGKAKGCGEYQDNIHLTRAMNWMRLNFRKEVRGRTFYNLYGIERLGRLTGQRFIGGHDWYREGCQYLAEKQQGNGSWAISWDGAYSYDSHTIISTSFSLLFLSKGRTPILISRTVHGAWPRNEADFDWNRDRNALRHLTNFASSNLFKKLPLAWQTYDVMQAIEAHGGAARFDELDVASDMLQSPIFFINGHRSPLNRFTEAEISALRKYVESGGFIIAEACCGSQEFDKGFRQLVENRLFPNNKLVNLPANHPIWKSHFAVPPGTFNLEGLQMGCKTVLVYASEDMSCRWEGNLKADKNFQGELAFRLGTNIIAYATGLEPPKPRLHMVELASAKAEIPPRGYFKAAQLKHGGDWQPAPRAVANLMDHLRKYAGIDADLEPEPLPLVHEDIAQFKFLYLHGRGNPKFDGFSEKDLENFKFNLETGGLLLADACCGDEQFDKKFREFVAKLFPKHKLEQVPFNDVVFSEDLNGVALTRENIRARQQRNGEMRPMPPWLEGIKINGHWAILYSKYDIGCALERHQSSDCIGYDYESAKKIAGAAALYLLRP